MKNIKLLFAPALSFVFTGVMAQQNGQVAGIPTVDHPVKTETFAAIIKKIIKYLLLIFVITNYTASAQTWSPPVRVVNTFVGTGGNIGQYSQLMSVSGYPAMASLGHGYLTYVRSSDSSGIIWPQPIILDSSSGEFISLQILNGNPAMSYFEPTNNDLKYIRATDASGTNWGTPITIDTGGYVGLYTSLVVVNGNPAISYYDATNGNLKYVRAANASGTAWSAPVILDATGDVGRYTSIQIVDGNPAISYSDVTNRTLKYIRATDASGTIWGTPITVNVQTIQIQNTCLKVVNGNPAISYYITTSPPNGSVQYIRATNTSGTAWGASVTISSSGGQYNSLQVVNGNPAISFYSSTKTLEYIRATDAYGATRFDWPTLSLQLSSADKGQYTSLQVVNGNPAISYYDATNGYLKYIRATGPNGDGNGWNSSITISVLGTVGLFTSLQIVNSNPAIAYYDQGNHDLIYVRAADISGTSWGISIPIDTAADVGQFASLHTVNGNPAIAYYDNFNYSNGTHGDLKYVRATDASGTSWSAPITIDMGGNVGQYISLQIVNGVPAISYYDVTNGDLKYVRAGNASGTVWNIPITLDGVADVGQYTSLQIINGNPAISYFDNTNRNLKYIRAIDASGITWDAPITLDTTGFVGASTSLQVVHGNPAISYYDFTKGDLKFVRANDASGITWGAPITIDSVGDVGVYNSLQIVNGNATMIGNPAISYYDNNNGDLKYIRATNSYGTAWGTASTLDAFGITGQYVSMISTSNGDAAIAYYNQSKTSPYFISGTFLSLITDYFRTKATGNWNNFNTWESSSDNINWHAATLTPDFNANTINILNYTITVTANLTIDQTMINPGGSVLVNPGVTLTVHHGAGNDDLIINNGGALIFN